MKYLLLLITLFFVACSTHTYEKQSKMVILKTPKIKFADVAYISRGDDAVVLDLYVAGKALKNISIDGMVCVDGEGCMQKSSFNDEYLCSGYPADLLKNVLLGKPIYGGENIERSSGEFSQSIKNAEVNIRYIVNAHRIYFKDKTNNILISIKDI